MSDIKDYLQGKNVCFFTAETVPSYAGSGLNAYRYAEFLSGFKASCRVICYNYNKKLKKKETINQVVIQRMSYFNKNIFTKLLSFPNLLRHYLIEVKRADIIFIYGRYLIGYLNIILFALLLKKKIIYRSTLLKCDDIESIKNHSGLLWPLYKLLFLRISCYWAVNQSFADIWMKYIGKKKSLVTAVQGVNKNHFYSKPHINVQDRKARNDIGLNILSCGILIKRKGYQEIFQALSEINLDFKYTVVGQYQPEKAHRSSEEERGEMEYLYKLGKKFLGGKIEFAGTRDNLVNYYHQADILIHGALNEGTPNVILESMASGLPIICKKMEGLSGKLLIDTQNCFEYETPGQLCDIINKIKNIPVQLKVITSNAYNMVTDNYSFEITLSKLIKCLNQ